MMKFISKNNKSGFTLVETLVAISIFTISILAVMVIIGKGISDTNFAKKKVTATYLASEGIEYMRNLRDTYMHFSGSAPAGWTAFFSKINNAGCFTASGPNGCFFDDRNVDFSSNSMPMGALLLTSCTSPACPNGALLYNSTTGKYSYTSGSASGFIRKMIVAQISADELKVSSTVTWTQGTGTYSVTFSENMFNWIEQ